MTGISGKNFGHLDIMFSDIKLKTILTRKALINGLGYKPIIICPDVNYSAYVNTKLIESIVDSRI